MKLTLKNLIGMVGLGLILSFGVLLVAPSIGLAAVPTTADGLSAVGDQAGLSNQDPRIIIGNIIRTGLTVIGIVLVCLVLYGGFIWMTAAGEAEKVDKAKNILKNAIIGLIIILLSWSIATFIISSLIGATGGMGSSTSVGGGGFSSGLGGSGSIKFTVNSYSPNGVSTIRNLVPRITFNALVGSGAVGGDITIRDASGTDVPGTFTSSGSVVKFTPATACPIPNSDRFCFDIDATYTITVKSTMKSANGVVVTCSTSLPCTATFTAGSIVDTANPTANITVPKKTISANASVDFQVRATDDAGVSSADFYLADAWQDSVAADGSPLAADIKTTIDTTNLTIGQYYVFKTTVVDLADNEDTDSSTVKALSETCFNGVTDADLGETSADCGGDSTSIYYCGACSGSSCTSDSDCASGLCTDGVCISNPIITDVSPKEGSVGTYVTITGTDLGAAVGQVLFKDAAGTGTVSATVLTQCSSGWSSSQIVVSVPEGAGDGALTVVTSAGTADTTDDDNGAQVPNFDVNSVVSPNLCSLSPNYGSSNDSMTMSGSNFGASQNSSTVTFNSTAAGSYTSWSDSAVKITIPSANAGTYKVSAIVDGYVSNTLHYSIQVPSGKVSSISSISPNAGGIGQYVTISGTNFGALTGKVMFSSSLYGDATASIDFPSACASDFWKDGEVTVIVPSKYDNGTALVVGNYTVTVVNQDGTVSSGTSFTVTTDAPTPGICGITTAGNIGDAITISGDHFGSTTDTITFSSDVTNRTATTWGNKSIVVNVPTGAVTGPVAVMVAGVDSNKVNFTVGAVEAVVAAKVVGGYSWMFSTGNILATPAVVSQCSNGVISSVPNSDFSTASQVCVNAVVYAEFTTLMSEASVEGALSVAKCTSTGSDTCATTENVKGRATAASSSTASRVTWVPTAEFDINSTYQVTISAAAISSEGMTLAKAVSWKFTTSSITEQCVVDRVTVTPITTTLTVINDTTGFGANASAGCVIVDSADYNWDWSLDSKSFADFDGDADDSCTGGSTNCATVEALAEGTTVILATAINANDAGNVTGAGSLIVNFSDPYIVNFWPDCTEACINADIGASFNTAMNVSDITSGDNILLYQCSNELCTNLTLIGSNPDCTYDSGVASRCTGFSFGAQSLTTSDYYRVIVSGRITSSSGVALIRTNYGSDYSWTFRVREDATLCAVERISISPASSSATAIGDSTVFSANAFGAADSCSASGQRLVASAYNWKWNDPIPDNSKNADGEFSTAVWYKTASGSLIDADGSSIPAGCSGICLPIGSSPYQAVCGDGVLDETSGGGGEECDDGNSANNDGCSSTCLYEGSKICATASDDNCCGNSEIEISTADNIAENCDDGNTVSADGCSNTCLAEGSASVNATCGNNDIAFDATSYAGETCDDGNNASGDGCSRLCLKEGSKSLSALGNALCGDGEITSPYENCDDDNVTDGDGCSSICVREGWEKCAVSTDSNCCGNGKTENDDTTEAGEDCDGGEGCSASCVFAGSAMTYSTPSVCGDGVKNDNGGRNGIGEASACESVSGSGDGYIDPSQVATIDDSASSEVSATTNLAIADVTVSEPTSSLTATAPYTLSCVADSDLDCSDTDIYGVGSSRCCVERADFIANNPTGDGVCRNSALYATFTKEMDIDSFVTTVEANGETTTTYNMYFVLNLESGQTCPSTYTKSVVVSMNWFQRVVATLKMFLIGPNAQAANHADCVVPIESYSGSALSDVTYRVTANTSVALEASSFYTLVIIGDDDVNDAITAGVKSKLGAGIKGSVSKDFTTGADICTLDAVVVTDEDIESPNLFTVKGESHNYVATAVSYANGTRTEISGVRGVYDWTWSDWGNSDDTVVTAAGIIDESDTASVVAQLANGVSMVTATAVISEYGSQTTEVTGSAVATTFLCTNPWPNAGQYPWTDDESGSEKAAVGLSGYMNFSLAYCRDYGETMDLDTDVLITDDDLPTLAPVLAPVLPFSGVLKEYLFKVVPTAVSASSAGDAIGVRVLSNSDHLSPMGWYTKQGFTGSPSAILVDGLEAVTDGRSTYVAAANVSDGNKLYSNIIVISYNEGASDETIDIYDQILTNAKFLTNIVDTNKQKIIRDTKRLADLQDMADLVATYAADNMTCSATTSKTCSADSDCPTSETCEAIVPALASGTAVRALSSSAWTSWSQALGGALDGDDLPTDPLNKYGDCTGYDGTTCVNLTSGNYYCPLDSYVYHYQAYGERTAILGATLEYTDLPWAESMDGVVKGNVKFKLDSFCGVGKVYGASSICGDGIIGYGADGVTLEQCEIGNVELNACADGSAGTENFVCNSTCSAYEASTDGVCMPAACGDGVIDISAGETCDDGSLNGTYGYCGSACTDLAREYCGDGLVSGGEKCDCGVSASIASSILGASIPFGGSSGSCKDRIDSTIHNYNGTYSGGENNTCAWNCAGPASYCGDTVVDSGETCDSNTDDWEGSLCVDGLTECTTDEDCAVVGGTCGDVHGACPTATICQGGTYDGYPCANFTWPESVMSSFESSLASINYWLYIGCLTGGSITDTTDNGTCVTTNQTYQTSRTRSCDDADSDSTCGWNAWNYCNYNGQFCGNGTVDGNEECDDGNEVATDACTTVCMINVCGDGYLYSGTETCDVGTRNGGGCDSAYGSTCTACTTSCNYTVSSGSYCGDGVLDSSDEYCDGADVSDVWFDYNSTTGVGKISGVCTRTTTDLNPSYTDDAGIVYSCRSIGMCNSGVDNGKYCTLPSTIAFDLASISDTYTCANGVAACVVPTCADDCNTTCPTSVTTEVMLITDNQPGSLAQTAVDLYSYSSSSTSNFPNAATITVPACTVAGNLIADVDFSNVTPPTLYVVFVTDTSGSMDYDVGATTRIEVIRASIKSGINKLFSEFGDLVHIGLVQYNTSLTGDAKVDTADLLGPDDELTLSEKIDGYTPSGNSSISSGLGAAYSLLDGIVDLSTNYNKIIIYLSDSPPAVGGSGDSAYNYTPDAEVLGILKEADMELYSIALTSTSSLITDMHIWSSNTSCEDDHWALLSCSTGIISNPSNLIDYSYSGITESAISAAYDTIISSITDGTISLISSSADGVVVTDTGTVTDARNIALPWPSNFVCDGVSEQKIPVHITFRGEGKINIGNIKTNYCAP